MWRERLDDTNDQLDSRMFVLFAYEASVSLKIKNFILLNESFIGS